jgi:hypothetical protein
MSRTVKAVSIAAVGCMLPGCIVTTVTEAESYDSIVTQNYSWHSEEAQPAQALDPECRWPCYSIGESEISFFPSKRSANVKAAGPIIPILPAPGKGTDYGDLLFFVGVHVHPGRNSFLTLDPSKYLISVDGHDDSLAPVAVKDCYGNPANLSNLQVYGSNQCFIFHYGISRENVLRFTLMPANVEADQITFMFPDINWIPGSYTWVE